MSNLLNDAEGRRLVLEAQRHLLRRRLSRFFKPDLVYDYERWSHGVGEFDLGTLIRNLNVAYDDELRDLYRLLGTIGGLDESIIATNVYVDPTNGSDITGTGSVDRPYASLWFLPFLPRVIKHPYHILLLDDLTMSGNFTLNVTFADADPPSTDRGCLNFIGVGAADELAPGDVLTGNAQFQTAWNEYDLNSTPPANAQQGFLQITSGARENYCAPVNRIDQPNKRLWTRYNPIDTVAGNESYHFVTPARRLTFRGFSISSQGAEEITTTGSSRAASRINFANLILDSHNQGLTVYKYAVISGLPVGFWFCQFKMTQSVYNYPIFLKDGIINEFNPVYMADLTESGVANLTHNPGNYDAAGLMIINRDAVEFGFGQPMLFLDGTSRLYSTDCMAKVLVEGTAKLYSSSAKQLFLEKGVFKVERFCADPNDATAFLAMQVFNGVAEIKDGLLGKTDPATGVGIYLYGARVMLDNVGGDAAATMSQYSFGTGIKAASIMAMHPWQGTRGVVGPNFDIVWLDIGATDVFPAGGAQKLDAIGSYCTGILF